MPLVTVLVGNDAKNSCIQHATTTFLAETVISGAILRQTVWPLWLKLQDNLVLEGLMTTIHAFAKLVTK